MGTLKLVIKLVLIAFVISSCRQKRSITILSWKGYDEPEIVSMIEDAVGADYEIKFIIYTGGEEMLKKYNNNKEQIDLIVADAEYGKILFSRNEIMSLEIASNKIISDNLKNYYSRFLSQQLIQDSVRFSDDPPGYDNNGKPYCLIIRWGTVALVADTSMRKQIDSEGYSVMMDKGLKGKISIFDWYLPNMGIFGLEYLDKHNIEKNPYDLTNEELDMMYNEIMKPVKQNVTSFHSDLGMVIKNVYDKNIKIVPGIGEWAIGNGFMKGDGSKNWFIPNSRKSIIWIESLAIPLHVEGEKRKAVTKILELFSGPELQRQLAWRNAYCSQVPNKKAYELMDGKQREFLNYSRLSEILSTAYYRKVPEPENLSNWLDKWTKFKN